MRRSLRPLLMILAASVALAARVEALPIPVNIVAGDKIIASDGTGSTAGGEFNINIVGKGGPLDFITFCIERDENLSFGPQFNVASITNQAWRGGVNTNSGDPLDSRTAYLYYKFVSGTLTNYGGGDAIAEANALQNIIWFYEQELTLAEFNATGALANAEALAWYNDANANAGTGNWGVQVINLQTLAGGYAQDLLVYTGVPEPASMVLLGSGLFGLRFLRRRASKSA